jgi:hypothetical protein
MITLGGSTLLVLSRLRWWHCLCGLIVLADCIDTKGTREEYRRHVLMYPHVCSRVLTFFVERQRSFF